jgi:hypothetical protein
MILAFAAGKVFYTFLLNIYHEVNNHIVFRWTGFLLLKLTDLTQAQ